nr:hypothetical protein [Tanacetum cinerariifolium]
TLRELIGSNRRLIPEARPPQLGVLRDSMPRPPRPTINDLYDRIDRIEIRQGELEMMSRRQSYHLDRELLYHRVILKRSSRIISSVEVTRV